MNTVVSSVTHAPSGTPYVKLELLDFEPSDVAMVRSGDQDGIAVILHLGDARKIGGDLIATADVSMWDTALPAVPRYGEVVMGPPPAGSDGAVGYVVVSVRWWTCDVDGRELPAGEEADATCVVQTPEIARRHEAAR